MVPPTGTSAIYMPVSSVVRVNTSPLLSVMTTSTPEIPGSPGSWTPLAFKSSNTVPLTLPVGVSVGEAVGAAVGALVGDFVGASVGSAAGAPDEMGEAVGVSSPG